MLFLVKYTVVFTQLELSQSETGLFLVHLHSKLVLGKLRDLMEFNRTLTGRPCIPMLDPQTCETG